MKPLRPYAILFGLALVAFWPLVLHPTETLYSNTSDLLAEHLPAKLFLVRSLRETGEVPFWNPEQYCGSPFVHDVQVGLFYPPHLPLYFMSENAVGPFLSWLLFAHVVLAGWFMYAYAHHAGMTELPAFVAGVGYMLSPRWMMQLFLAGHIVTQGICWLPLVLLCVERAIQRGRWSWAIGGGVAYAMLILGTHPQWTFYASLLIGAWPLRLVYARWQASLPRKRGEEAGHSQALLAADYGEPGCVSAGSASPSREQALPALTQPGSPVSARKLLLRWFPVEAIVVIIGLGLCAVQLLPTMEAAGQSSRGKGMGHSWSLDGAKAAAGTLIGPFPESQAEPIHWETRGGIGFTWAVMALVGARFGGRRQLVPIIIALAMLAYALGASYFIDRLPGFNNFRMPTRMLLTFAFPVAWFAGLGVYALKVEKATYLLRAATIALTIVVGNFGAVAFLSEGVRVLRANSGGWTVYWMSVVAGWTWFVIFGIRWPHRSRTQAAVIFLVLDALSLVLPYANSRPMGQIYPKSKTIDYIRANNSDGHRIDDAYEVLARHGGMVFGGRDENAHLLGPGSPGASVFGVPSILGYNPLDVARYRQFLAFISDVKEPQDAFSGQYTNPVTLSFPRNNPRLFDLLGVRVYEVIGTHWLDGNEGRWIERGLVEQPTSYNFLERGVELLPQVRLVEDRDVMPRAMVVGTAIPQVSEVGVLPQLKSIDIRHTATLEDWDPAITPLPQSNSPPGPAKIQSYKPNEIRIALNGRTAGLLVLTDPWYPGWVCRVDGNEVPIWKADYAFRGVMVPEGSREVVFHFQPQSYRRGKWISLATLAVVSVLIVVGLVRRRRFTVTPKTQVISS